METKMTSTAAILGMTAIILGAFGAHALRQVLNADQLATFETGVRYQMYHALLLLFVSLSPCISDRAKKGILYFVIFGVLLFSGSIYLLATDDLMAFNARSIGFITPIGGMLLIVAWFWLFVDFMRKKP
jgi:uncharacterized membrane protein YgdD (TMEM256/DUF423 family)